MTLPCCLRIACACLGASRLAVTSTFQRTILPPSRLVGLFAFPRIVAVSPLTSTQRAMTSSDDAAANPVAVGQVDIGKLSDGYDEEVDDNEVTSMSWRSRLEISNAKSRKIRGSNYVQLATVDPISLEPRCRCVVVRGFLDLPQGHECAVTACHPVDGNDRKQRPALSCVLKMCTDRRSEKVHQIVSHTTSIAELVWWFPKTSEQYRIRGELVFVGGDGDDTELVAARKQLWGNLSDAARESFLEPRPPGVLYSAITAEVAASIPKGGRTPDAKVVPPPDSFLLMLLKANHCDYLRLTNMYRQVDNLDATGIWTLQRLNP